MPELPEVEVVRAGLAPALVGARIEAVTVLDPRALTRHAGDAASFERALNGRTLSAAARRGKFLWLPLEPAAGAVGESSEAIVGHLGMSGQMLLRPSGAEPERHERIRLDIVHPAHGDLAVVFSDQRTFGSLAVDQLVPTADGAACGASVPHPPTAPPGDGGRMPRRSPRKSHTSRATRSIPRSRTAASRHPFARSVPP